MCIPRMESIYTNEFIRTIFEKINIGKIKNIIEIPNKKNFNYKKVIINIYLNKESDMVNMINTRFSNGNDIKIFYNEFWYWKIYLTK